MSEDTVQADDLEEVVDTESVDELSTETEEVNDDAPEEQKKQSRSQNAKHRLRRKLKESEAQNIVLAGQIKEQNDRFSTLEKKVDGVINPNVRPQRVDFESEEEYEDDLYAWRQPEVEKPAPTEKLEPKPVERPRVMSEAVQQNWDDQQDTAIDKYDDFEEVIHAIPSKLMSDIMANTIFESKQGGDVAYFLGTNLKEAERISKLGLSAQVRELDKLSNKFKSSTSNAPTPISPTKGGSTETKDVEKMSPEDYRAMRRKQRAR